MDSESIFYELSPYLYALAGLIAVSMSSSLLTLGAGVMLIVSGVVMLVLRYQFRRRKLKDKNSEPNS